MVTRGLVLHVRGNINRGGHLLPGFRVEVPLRKHEEKNAGSSGDSDGTDHRDVQLVTDG